MRDRLFVKLAHGTAPLMIWALHFGVCYGLVAAQCSPALYTSAMPGTWLLWLATAAAIGACGWLLWRARAGLAGDGRLDQLACAASAVLALAGIVWTAVPLALLDGCG